MNNRQVNATNSRHRRAFPLVDTLDFHEITFLKRVEFCFPRFVENDYCHSLGCESTVEKNYEDHFVITEEIDDVDVIKIPTPQNEFAIQGFQKLSLFEESIFNLVYPLRILGEGDA